VILQLSLLTSCTLLLLSQPAGGSYVPISHILHLRRYPTAQTNTHHTVLGYVTLNGHTMFLKWAVPILGKHCGAHFRSTVAPNNSTPSVNYTDESAILSLTKM